MLTMEQATKVLDSVRAEFAVAPSSAGYHCSYKGGLAVHTANVVNAAERLSSCLTPEQAEQLKALAMIHDVGKINEYGLNGSAPFYRKGAVKHFNGGTVDICTKAGVTLDAEELEAIKLHHGYWTKPVPASLPRLAGLLHTCDMMAVMVEELQEKTVTKPSEGTKIPEKFKDVLRFAKDNPSETRLLTYPSHGTGAPDTFEIKIVDQGHIPWDCNGETKYMDGISALKKDGEGNFTIKRNYSFKKIIDLI